MYQLTFFDCGMLLAVTCPNKAVIEGLYYGLEAAAHPRMWYFASKGVPQLLM